MLPGPEARIMVSNPRIEVGFSTGRNALSGTLAYSRYSSTLERVEFVRPGVRSFFSDRFFQNGKVADTEQQPGALGNIRSREILLTILNF